MFAAMSRHHGQFTDAVKVVRGVSALIGCILPMTTRAGRVCDDCTNLGTFEWKRKRINKRFQLPRKSKTSIRT